MTETYTSAYPGVNDFLNGIDEVTAKRMLSWAMITFISLDEKFSDKAFSAPDLVKLWKIGVEHALDAGGYVFEWVNSDGNTDSE